MGLAPRPLQRFRNEAKAAASLHHSNIVPVHAVGCEHGVYFDTMQIIDGQTLAEVIRRRDRRTLRRFRRPACGRASGELRRAGRRGWVEARIDAGRAQPLGQPAQVPAAHAALAGDQHEEMLAARVEGQPGDGAGSPQG